MPLLVLTLGAVTAAFFVSVRPTASDTHQTSAFVDSVAAHMTA